MQRSKNNVDCGLYYYTAISTFIQRTIITEVMNMFSYQVVVIKSLNNEREI